MKILILMFLLSIPAMAQVYEYKCEKDSEVWNYFYKTDGIVDEVYKISFDSEIILFETDLESFYYSINAVSKEILNIIKDNAVLRKEYQEI